MLARRQEVAKNRSWTRREESAADRGRTGTPDNLPEPLSGPAAPATKLQGLERRGMGVAEKIGAVNLHGQLVEAHI